MALTTDICAPKILADYIREHGPLRAQHQQEFTIIVEHPQVTLADKQFLYQALKQARLITPQPIHYQQLSSDNYA